MGKTRFTAGGVARTAIAAAMLLAAWTAGSLPAEAETAARQAPAATGTYRIVNAASHTVARAYRPGETVFVASTLENPGPFALWEITRAEPGFTIKNVGLGDFARANATREGEPVVTGRAAETWAIHPAGDGTFVIKAPNHDLLWNVERPVVPRGEVKLRGADGSETQRWRIIPVAE
ncbi:hypothetical protein [Nonomuraea longicatena]